MEQQIKEDGNIEQQQQSQEKEKKVQDDNNIPNINEQTQTKKCDHCQKESDKLMVCNGCKEVRYCSQECQKQNWKVHKQNCAYFKQKQIENLPLYKGISWFDMEQNIGHGNFSEIWKAKCKKDEKYYAIKVIQKQRVRQLNKEKDLEMEKHCLQRLNGSPYFIEFVSNFDDEQTYYMQLELVSGGELWHQCRIFGIVSIHLFKYYFGHILNAIEAMHSKGIVHRDLKNENIMVTKDHKIKIIDFGTARDVENPHITGAGQGAKGKKNYAHFVGTPNYMAPEQIRNKGSSQETDMYALAGVAFQLWGGFPAYLGNSEYLIFQQSLEEDPVYVDCLFKDYPELKDLIAGLCKKEMQDRSTIAQIKAHPFFAGFNFDEIPPYEHFASQPLNKIDEFILKMKTEILQSESKFKDNQKAYDEQFMKYVVEVKNNEELYQNQLLRQRISMMRAQGLTLVDHEQFSFSWKDNFTS